MNNLAYRHLLAFIQVAEHGSFTHAAEFMHVTQSTLTATIKQLESQVGIQLFDRTTRRVSLTEAGERFLPVALQLVSDFDTAIEDLQASAQQQRGHVAVAGSSSMLTQLLPAIICRYREDYPKINVTLIETGASGIEEAVLSNRASFGIGGNHSNSPDLTYQPILRDRYGVVMRDDDPLCAQKEVDWTQLQARRLAMLSQDNGIRLQLEWLLASNDIPLLLDSAVIEANTPTTLASLVRHGAGLTLLPALAATTPAFVGLVFRPLSAHLERELNVILRRGRSLSPAGEELLARCQTHCRTTMLPNHVARV
ncbi:LysR family transcriptional regulator [Neptunomonas sp. XY-337]|uniref:LysR family transcriptional regulator n=1 Tax=Neptunomonas sp. XY-337 TaxID=2561897 RepID=UPI0010AA556C|nr:LysR family transcriptional regulator [Neptunomonas sp. XY-337]